MPGDIRLIGNWNLATRLAHQLNSDVEKTGLVVLKQVGLKTERLMIKYILSQPSTWSPLSQKYIARKVAAGKSNQMLIATSSMLQAITSNVNGSTVFAGVKRESKNKEGESIANIAAVMAFGSKARGIPARDFITPVYKQMLREIKRGMFQKALAKHLKAKYGI